MKTETFNISPDFLQMMSTSKNLDRLNTGSVAIQAYLYEFHTVQMYIFLCFIHVCYPITSQFTIMHVCPLTYLVIKSTEKDFP
jgi:hypothetical protein